MKIYNADGPEAHREIASQIERLYSTLNNARKKLLESYVEDVQPTFQQWLDLGVKLGYCEEIHCMAHEGPVLTEEEDKIFIEGCDPCVPLIRVYLEGDSPCSSI
jgi:hypothetical protein